MKKNIAVFDFDGTITKKDTLLEFIKFTKGTQQFYTGFLLFSPLLIAMKSKLYPNWKAKQRLFSFFYKGTSIHRFNQWSNDFIKVIDLIIRDKAIYEIEKHKKKQ